MPPETDPAKVEQVKTLKTCSECGESKPVTAEYFYRRPENRDGFFGRCKTCVKEWSRSYQERANELARARRAANPGVSAEKQRVVRARDPERMRGYERKYRESHPGTRREYHREYRLRNIEKLRVAKREQQRIRLQEVGYRVSNSMSTGMRASLRHGKDGRKWESLAGYSREELIAHLESQFVEGMTWENFGRHGWHIDHVVPKSWFHFDSCDDPEFKMCWALKNLQPLWEFDNLSKSNRVVE